jgi:hypothetical protein
MQVAVALWNRVFFLRAGSNPGGTQFFFLFFSFFSSFFYIQMFFYTIMNICIILLENVNKSRTNAGSLSLSLCARLFICYLWQLMCRGNVLVL